MNFVAFIMLGFVSCIAPVSAKNVTCLTIQLFDSFGDGWGSDTLMVVKNDYDVSVLPQPSLAKNPVVHKQCGLDGGRYIFLMAALAQTQNPWEIIWKIKIDETGEYFTGGFSTQMVFDYDKVGESWSMFGGSGLLNNTQILLQCGSSIYAEGGVCDDINLYSRNSVAEIPSSSPTRDPHNGIYKSPRVGRGMRPKKSDSSSFKSLVSGDVTSVNGNTAAIPSENYDENETFSYNLLDHQESRFLDESSVKSSTVSLKKGIDSDKKSAGRGTRKNKSPSSKPNFLQGSKVDNEIDEEDEFMIVEEGGVNVTDSILPTGSPSFAPSAFSSGMNLSDIIDSVESAFPSQSVTPKEVIAELPKKKSVRMPSRKPTQSPVLDSVQPVTPKQSSREKKVPKGFGRGKSHTSSSVSAAIGKLTAKLRNDTRMGIAKNRFEGKVLPTPLDSLDVEVVDAEDDTIKSMRTMPAELEITMFDPTGEGWYSSGYDGSMFYISDESKTTLVAFGTLGNGSFSGYCEYCMTSGSFYLRVTEGASGENRRWRFCHTNGTVGEELAFHIEDGECIPDALLDVSAVVSESYYTIVTLTGTLSLEGSSSEMFDEGEAWAVENTLGSSVYGWDPTFTEINSVMLNLHRSQSSSLSGFMSRALTSFTYDIEFETSFVSEIAYEIDGTSYAAIQRLVSSLRSVLESSVVSGEFKNALRDVATDGGVVSLKSTSAISLLSLQLKEVNYIGSLPLVTEGINSFVEDLQVNIKASASSAIEIVQVSSLLTNFDVGAVLLMGFVVLVAVFVQVFRRSSSGAVETAEDDQDNYHGDALKGRRSIEISTPNSIDSMDQRDFVDNFVLLHPVPKKQLL